MEEAGNSSTKMEVCSDAASSDDECCWDDTKSNSNPSLSEACKFEILTHAAIANLMASDINEVKELINLPATITRIVLIFYKWDKDKLIEHYFERGPEEIFAKANVLNPNQKNFEPTRVCIRDNKELCEICVNYVHRSLMDSIQCGHRFCKSCWKTFIFNKIMNEGQAESIECPFYKCNALLDDAKVLELANDMKVCQRYQKLITNYFVATHRLLRHCPRPGCMKIAKVEMIGMQKVICSCRKCFCFQCGNFWHDPVHCNLLKKWIGKCNHDSATFNWIVTHTKECPKCHALIQKDGGCNHIICKNHNCKYDFCWVCLGSWEPHGSQWYSCNRYDDNDTKIVRNAQETQRSFLKRFLHYCNRYLNHERSLKFENDLYKFVKNRMEYMQQFDLSWIEVQFLKQAVDILCECRVVLMATYVFGYYVKKNNQLIIFLNNQGDLESSVEDLSEYLERDITTSNLIEIKQKIIDKAQYCEKRRKALLSHVHEGNEKNWWEYIE